MHSRFYAPSLVSGGRLVELPAEEAEHLVRVLRLRAGDEVRVFDGCGREFEGRVETTERSRVVVAVERELPEAGTEPAVAVTLAQALLKGDAMDQVVRDAVMLGVSRIVPLETERCEVTAKRVIASNRVARWQRIAVASVKQCGRAVVPEVAVPQRLDACLREFRGTARYLLAEPGVTGGAGEPGLTVNPRGAALPDDHAPAHRPGVLLIVGPEGGWSAEEVAAGLASGCRLLTLGRRILRADAAAIVGLTTLQCLSGEFILPV